MRVCHSNERVGDLLRSIRLETIMLMAPLFQPFVEQSPLSVMARLTIERALRPQLLDELFARTAQRQYTKDLLFGVPHGWWTVGKRCKL